MKVRQAEEFFPSPESEGPSVDTLTEEFGGVLVQDIATPQVREIATRLARLENREADYAKKEIRAKLATGSNRKAYVKLALFVDTSEANYLKIDREANAEEPRAGLSDKRELRIFAEYESIDLVRAVMERRKIRFREDPEYKRNKNSRLFWVGVEELKGLYLSRYTQRQAMKEARRKN